MVTSQWVLPYLPLCGGEGRFMIPVVIHQVLQLKKGAFRVHVCVCVRAFIENGLPNDVLL